MGASMGIAMAAMVPMDQGKQGKQVSTATLLRCVPTPVLTPSTPSPCQDKDAGAKRSAGSMVGEVVLGIRTVASFNAEVKFYDDYCETMDAMLVKGKKRSFYGGCLAGAPPR